MVIYTTYVSIVILVAAVYEYQELNLNEERQTRLQVSDHTAPSDENDYEPIPSDVTTNTDVYSYVDVPRTPATNTGSPLGRKSTECNDNAQ